MITSALTNLGTNADLWSQLKSIDHTLNRILDNSGKVQLTDFDRERLKELILFLKNDVLQVNSSEPLSPQSLLVAGKSYSAKSRDLKEEIGAIESFRAWQAPSKLGFEKKIQTLISDIESFVGRSSQEFFPKFASVPSFSIARDLIASILGHLEPTVLQARMR